MAIIDLKGVTASEWRRETVLLQPDLSGPLQYAIDRYGIPTPPGDQGYTYTGEFQVEQWAPFAALSSMLNQHESINSGYAVDLWRPNPFATKTDASPEHRATDCLLASKSMSPSATATPGSTASATRSHC